MDATYWQKQTKDQPLFPDMLWSRPENKRLAGKLLIVGGNKFNFNAPAAAYDAAETAGIGVAKVLLPDALAKTIGSVLENCEFAPTNKSGSFARAALAEWLEWSRWADGVLLAGDVGRNSETAIVLESFLREYHGPVIITQDCLDQFLMSPQKLFLRPNTTIVAAFGQLQKMWSKLGQDLPAITFGLPLARNLELLHELSKDIPANIITTHSNQYIVAVAGQVSTTPAPKEEDIWRVKSAARAGVWLIQNPQQSFRALSTALLL